MAELYKQIFLRSLSENPNRESDFSLFESVGEYFERNTADAKNYFSRYQTARDRIGFYKAKVMSDLANYLIDFELNLSRSGAKVIYAETEIEAMEEINRILDMRPQEGIFISGDDILQEINLKFSLKSNKKHVFQSDMQKFPYPILSQCADKVLSTLVEAYTVDDFKPSKDQVMDFYKKHLVEKLYHSATVITGADFLVSDTGAVVLSDNNGLNSLYTSFCKRHIVVAGIDQLILALADLDYFTAMLSAHTYGRKHVSNEIIITGPKTSKELDGPEELYVILLDNGRTKMLWQQHQRSILSCIGCKACQALCPVFKFTNRLDNPPLKGPRNCIIDPIGKNFEDNAFLSFACTLCGKCGEVCPAKINLPELILYNRKAAVEKQYDGSVAQKQMRTLNKMLMRQKSLDSSRLRFGLKLKFKKMYGPQREFPDFGKKGFRLKWLALQEQKNNNE